MKIFTKRIIAFCITLILCMSVVYADTFAESNFPVTDEGSAVIFVSPVGSDSNKGTIDSPLKTLEAARKYVREYKERVGDNFKGITVYLREGSYNVPNGFKLGEEDGGTQNGYVTYSAYNDEKVSITASVTLDVSKFTPVTDSKVLAKIPQEAAPFIRQLVLSDVGVTDFGAITEDGRNTGVSSRMLYVDGKHKYLAKYPNSGMMTIADSTKSGEIIIDDERIERWREATQAWAYGKFYWEWADYGVPVREIDVEKKALIVKNPSYGIRGVRGKFRIYNLIEELDTPEEWFLDASTGILYLFDDGNFAKKEISFVTSQSTLVTLENTSFVKFNGITFEGTRNCAFEIIDSSDNLITNCVIRNIGLNAAKIIRGKRNGFEYCHIYDVGKGGFKFGLYSKEDYNNLTPAENYIENCHIERVDIYTSSYAGAVDFSGVGDRISHCRINMSQMTGVTFNAGINNIIEYNDVYDVMKTTNDQGVFYGGRYWNAPGNVMRYNSVHDCTGIYTVEEAAKIGWFVQGVYLDDHHSGQIIEGNIFSNLMNGIFIHAGRSNVVKDNLFVNCATAIEVANYNRHSDKEEMQEALKNYGAVEEIGVDEFVNTAIITYGDEQDLLSKYKSYWNLRNTSYGEIWDKQFPYLKDLMTDLPALPKYNVVTGNIAFGGKGIIINDYAVENGTVENNFQTTEVPELVNGKEGFYTPKDEQIYENVENFEPLDITETGVEGEHNIKVGEFKSLYPLNGIEEVEANKVMFTWEHSSGADSYRLIVATDANFENLVYNGVIRNNAKELSLRYGKQKYYWKVLAQSSSHAYVGTVQNSNGVLSFRTKETETVNKTKLENQLAIAQNEYNNAVEGEGQSQFFEGSKEGFLPSIENAENVLNKIGVSQRDVDKELKRLTTKYNLFTSLRNPEEVDIGVLLADKDNWRGLTGGATITGDKITVPAGTYPRYSQIFRNYQTIKLKANFDFGSLGDGWSSFGLRTSSFTAANPWSHNNYILIVKKDLLELQAYQSGFKWIHELPNEYITEGKDCIIQMAAVACDEGVRVTVHIDGKEVYNVVDNENIVEKEGYFGIFHVTGGSVTVSSAE